MHALLLAAAMTLAPVAPSKLTLEAIAGGTNLSGPSLNTIAFSPVGRQVSYLRGYFWTSVQAARRMRAAGGGAIVNIASVNARRAAPGQGIYSMTKAGIVNMTEGLAKELAPHGIRVNAILPGLTETKFASAITSNPKLMDMMLRLIPMGRSAQPGEIAPAALFLLSPAAGYVTGTTLAVDKIRVNAVSPGTIRTPAVDACIRTIGMTLEEGYERFGNDAVLKRLGEPIEIAHAVLFLASDEASYVTGANLVVDGGATID